MNKIKEISEILSGKASVEETQGYLETISKSDVLNALSEKEMAEAFKAYLEKNSFTPVPIPIVSKKEMDEIWDNIFNEAQEIGLFRSWRENLWSRFFRWGKRGFLGTPVNTLAMASVLALAILVFPVIQEHLTPSRSNFMEIKGEKTSKMASLQYALVGAQEKLMRPDRPLTEADTIAFRMSVAKNGYGSVYVIHNGRADKIISDLHFRKGDHDLDTGYQFKGSRGENTLVLMFSESALNMDETAKQQLIVESERNGVSSMTIENKIITLSYEKIEIR